MIKTVVLWLRAMIALAWICVLGGSTPLDNRVIIDFGRVRSCSSGQSVCSHLVEKCFSVRLAYLDSDVFLMLFILLLFLVFILLFCGLYR